MAHTTKQLSDRDADQTLQSAYNEVDASITTNGFLIGKVGHKIVRTIQSGTVDDYSFYDGSVLLYTLRITYNNTNHDEMNQSERIA